MDASKWVLRGSRSRNSLPLILAASQPMAALYRSVNTYPHLVAEREHGNPDSSSDAELGEAARSILDGVGAEADRERARHTLRVTLRHRNRLIPGDVADESGERDEEGQHDRRRRGDGCQQEAAPHDGGAVSFTPTPRTVCK